MRVDVWSDFMCPYCFLVSISLSRLKRSHDVHVTWRSFELRPKGAPPPSSATIARIEALTPQFQALAQAQHNITIDRGPFGISSRLALIGDIYAREQGLGEAYHDAVFKAYWTQARDISDLEVLTDIALSVGLTERNFHAALHNPRYEKTVEAEIAQAYKLNITGVPGLLFADKYLIPGAQPYEDLARFVDYIRHREEKRSAESAIQ